jgi:hypothetical protein
MVAGSRLSPWPHAGHLNHEEAGVLAAFARWDDPALRQTLGHQWLAFCTARAPRPERTGGARWPPKRSCCMRLPLAGLRFGTRRTLAQMSPLDFITAVAMGATIRRITTSSTTSCVAGAVAVVTLIAVHRLVSLLRYRPVIRRLTDHRIRVPAADGCIRPPPAMDLRPDRRRPAGCPPAAEPGAP